MTKENLTKKWLSVWLYAICTVSVIIIIMMIMNWSVWNVQTMLFASATALLPIHVLEEWHFPGGFHTMYNLMKGSDAAHTDRYPMNQLSDMWTNFIGVVFGCIVLLVGVNPVFLIMQLFLCCAEVVGHFTGGFFVLNRFKDKGKKTIYNPGLFTTIFGYIPIAVGIIMVFVNIQTPTAMEIIIGLLCSIILGAFSLKIVEKICMNENSPYRFTWGSGYFGKYVDE